jgi:tRNA (guanine-N7-)-methyltransferase
MAEAKRRLIYGRRQGRPLKTQAQAALHTQLPRLAFALDDLARPQALFPGCDRLALEIGFGGGEHLIALARANPQTGFIGAEPFLNGVAKLAQGSEELSNLRIHHGDARDVLERLPDAALDRLFLLFPDPWHKLRHHKRRFVSAENLRAIARVMKPGAVWRVASDIADYVRWTLEEIACFNRVHGHTFQMMGQRADDWRIRPADWPATRYEAKALTAGRVPAYLTFVRSVGAASAP